jgi:hypothetical protein
LTGFEEAVGNWANPWGSFALIVEGLYLIGYFSGATGVAVAAPEKRDCHNLVRRAVGVGACLLETELGTEAAADIEELASLSAHFRGGERVWEAVRTVRRRSGS